MRKGIHPDYYQAKVVCNCGNEFVTGSTKEEICLIRSMAFRPTNKNVDSLRLFYNNLKLFFYYPVKYTDRRLA